MRRFLVAWGMVATLLAQQPQLQQVGMTSARGGRVVACAFDGEGEHMLTVGAEGDVVYQDLATLEVLSRHELPGAEVDALLLHPREPRALFVTRAVVGGVSSLFALDLHSGDWHLVGECAIEVMAQDAAGERVACLVATPHGFVVEVWPWAAVGAKDTAPLHRRQLDGTVWRALRFEHDGVVLSELADGKSAVPWLRLPLDGSSGERGLGPVTGLVSPREVVAVAGQEVVVAGKRARGNIVHQLAPEERDWLLDEASIVGGLQIWGAPRGELLVADQQGQLHVLGPAVGQRRVTSVHRAPVAQVVWSPDGRFLGIVALGGVRFVDTNGQQVGEHQGSCLVMPGDAGPEFLLLDGLGVERFHASSQRRIGERIENERGRFAVLRYQGTRPEVHRRFAPAALGRGRGAGRLPDLGSQPFDFALLLVDDQGRLSTSDKGSKSLLLLEPHSLCLTADPGVRLIAWSESVVAMRDRARVVVKGAVQAVDGEGNQLACARFAASPLWLRRAPGGRRFVVGLADGSVRRLDLGDLEQPIELRAAGYDEPPLQWFDFVDEQRGLGGDGEQVWWVQSHTFSRTPAKLPAGFGKADGGVVAPDGKHVVLVHGCDVTIAAIR